MMKAYIDSEQNKCELCDEIIERNVTVDIKVMVGQFQGGHVTLLRNTFSIVLSNL